MPPNTQSVCVLKAIRWVHEAWNSVKEDTIIKCLRKSEVTGSTFSVVNHSYEDEDPFDDVETQEESHDLVTKPLSQELIEDYISGEDGVPVSMQYDDDWEDRFFAELGSSQADSDSLVQEDPHEEEGQFT